MNGYAVAASLWMEIGRTRTCCLADTAASVTAKRAPRARRGGGVTLGWIHTGDDVTESVLHEIDLVERVVE